MSFLCYSATLTHENTLEDLHLRLKENIYVTPAREKKIINLSEGSAAFKSKKEYLGVLRENNFKIAPRDYPDFKSYFTLIEGKFSEKSILLTVRYNIPFILFLLFIFAGGCIGIARIVNPHPQDTPYIAHFMALFFFSFVISFVLFFKKIAKRQIRDLAKILNIKHFAC